MRACRWPEELRIPLGEGTPRPPQIRITLVDKDLKSDDDTIAEGSTFLGTAPQGKEKLYLKGVFERKGEAVRWKSERAPPSGRLEGTTPEDAPAWWLPGHRPLLLTPQT